MRPFIYSPHPSRIIFGHGTMSTVKAEMSRLNCSKAVILTTPQQIEIGKKLEIMMGDAVVGSYYNATMHTPVDVTLEAVEYVRGKGADCVIAIGGGSTTGLGKAIALHTDLVQIVLPTTYAGSEVTPILGQTENGLKTTQSTLKVLPEVVIYDVDLTMSLPLGITLTSGFNAIAHAVEALYSKDNNPIIDQFAVLGIQAMVKALPKLKQDLQDVEARSDALFAAWACGTCLGQTSMSIHHKLCHVLGGSFNTPHSETHTVILPHAIHYNALYAPEAIAKVASAMGVQDAAKGIYDLCGRLGGPQSLKELGFKREDLEKAADLASKASYPNPAPLEKEKLLDLLTAAFEGKPPGWRA